MEHLESIALPKADGAETLQDKVLEQVTGGASLAKPSPILSRWDVIDWERHQQRRRRVEVHGL